MSRWGIDGTMSTYAYTVDAGTNEILAWYRQNMKGWTLKQESIGSAGAFQKYTFNDQDGALILVLFDGSASQDFLVTVMGKWDLLQSLGSEVDLSAPGPFFAPGRGAPTFTISPVSPDDINNIIPLGNLNPTGGHILPTDHSYVWLNPGDYEIAAPADGVITEIDYGQPYNDYNIYVDCTSTFEIYFNHLTKIAGWVLQQTGQAPNAAQSSIQVNIPVRAGDIIATATSVSLQQQQSAPPGTFLHGGFDMGAINLDVNLNLIYPNGYPVSTTHAVCPLDYFEKSIQDSLYSKVQRTAEPRGGKIDFDQSGRLVGNWFSGEMRDILIAFVYDVNDPTQVRISIGGTGGTPGTGAGLFGIAGNALDPATISVTSGSVVYTLQEIIPGYNQNPGTYTLLVKMLDDERIQVEAFPDVVPNAQFTSASIIYTRGWAVQASGNPS